MCLALSEVISLHAPRQKICLPRQKICPPRQKIRPPKQKICIIQKFACLGKKFAFDKRFACLFKKNAHRQIFIKRGQKKFELADGTGIRAHFLLLTFFDNINF